MTHAVRRSWTRTLLAAVLVVQLGGCGEAEQGGDDGSAGSGGGADEVCYFEYRSSYSCADGDGDPGEWEATCSAIAEDACGGADFDGTSDYVDGCLFVTEFRSVQWIDAVACEAMLPDPQPNPDPSSTGTTGGTTGGGTTGGGTTGGGTTGGGTTGGGTTGGSATDGSTTTGGSTTGGA